jgi:hypothetical protein
MDYNTLLAARELVKKLEEQLRWENMMVCHENGPGCGVSGAACRESGGCIPEDSYYNKGNLSEDLDEYFAEESTEEPKEIFADFKRKEGEIVCTLMDMQCHFGGRCGECESDIAYTFPRQLPHVEVKYDFHYEGVTTYGCIKRFDTEEGARKWIDDHKTDPYMGRFEIIIKEVE